MTKRVMIVDDNDFVRDSVEMFFTTEGMDVVTASNGFECLRHLENGFRGVILLDIQMPRMDGWETIRRMVEKDLQRENVIVVLSAKVADECKDPDCMRYVSDYITKPFLPKDLLNAVKQSAEGLGTDQQAANG